LKKDRLKIRPERPVLLSCLQRRGGFQRQRFSADTHWTIVRCLKA